MPNTNWNIAWDEIGKHFYETGVDHVVLYPVSQDGTYPNGVAWNGLTGVDENPDGGEINDIWADNIKYATFQTPENSKGSITALMFPPEFYPCLGMAVPDDAPGLAFAGQPHKAFSFVYRTELGTDANEKAGYVLHFVYNCKVQPSSKSHSTKNENPDPEEMSWDYSATPVNVTGVTGVTTTASFEVKSTLFTKAQMTALENLIYGTNASGDDAATDPTLPDDPGTIYSTLKAAAGG
jgi:hypothetical protein